MLPKKDTEPTSRLHIEYITLFEMHTTHQVDASVPVKLSLESLRSNAKMLPFCFLGGVSCWLARIPQSWLALCPEHEEGSRLHPEHRGSPTDGTNAGKTSAMKLVLMYCVNKSTQGCGNYMSHTSDGCKKNSRLLVRVLNSKIVCMVSHGMQWLCVISRFWLLLLSWFMRLGGMLLLYQRLPISPLLAQSILQFARAFQHRSMIS